MSSLWRQIVICFRLYWIWSHVSADGEILENNVRLTWNESLKHCEDNGKVLFDTTKTDYKVTLRKILKGTNKAWVSARVEFSHFVKIPVCMEKSSQLVRYKSYDTDIISNCVNVCNNYWYAGLEDKDCYCVDDAHTLKRSIRFDKTIADPIVHGCKECVYAMSTSGVLKIFTESCLGHSADGAICEAAKKEDFIVFYRNLKAKCKESNSLRCDKVGSFASAIHYTKCRERNWTIISGELCLIDHVNSLTWKQAKQNCEDIGGNLMSSKISAVNMTQNSTYWFGLYRIPIIHKMNALTLDANDTCCAVARIEEDTLLVEGDDCRAKHAFICQDKSSQSTEKPIPGEQSNSEPTDRRVIYGVVAVCAVLFVAFVITTIICIFRRRQLSQDRANGCVTHSTIEEHALLEQRISSPSPKPTRKTHTQKEIIDSSYENVIFLRGRQDIATHQLGYSNFEYDKINFDKACVQEIDNTNRDTHVYDHGSLNKTEEQYDVMNMPGDITPIMDETYDRTTV